MDTFNYRFTYGLLHNKYLFYSMNHGWQTLMLLLDFKVLFSGVQLISHEFDIIS